MRRLAPVACLAALLIAGCGGGTKTVTETTTQAQTPGTTSSATSVAETTVTATTPEGTTTATTPVLHASPAGNHGPHYFETPSHNIGCYMDSHSVRCDIRQRTWSPPPKPQYCIKAGVDWGQGVGVGSSGRATIVCAGDTTLGGPGLLGYGHTSQRGVIVCASARAGMTCRNTATSHGFFLSRETYRLF